MKRITLLLANLFARATMKAEKFKLGKLTFRTISATEVELDDAKDDITSVHFGDTITYQGKTYRLTSIGGMAFKGCKKLKSVTIPNSVTSIGDLAFEGCSSLKSIKVRNGNPIYDSRENCKAIIETATNTLIAGCQNTIIPNSVTSIGESAFSGCYSLTSITIPNSVTSIGYMAFEGCSSLTSITIPNSVTSIGYRAFRDCSNLTSITIPNSVTSIGNWAFYDCSNLTSVTVPSHTKIGTDAFPKHIKIIRE